MALFQSENEIARKRRLKELEDKRLRFAKRMQQEGFAPERMLLLSTEKGGLAGLCRDRGQVCLIVGPDFGGEGEFVLERYDALPARREEFFQASEGLGGVFGLGKKGREGFYLIIERESGALSVPFIVHLNSAMLCDARNPLLSVKRRRGDANVVWYMQPMDKRVLKKADRMLREILEDQ